VITVRRKKLKIVTWLTETHTLRQAIQQDCPPNLCGRWDKRIEIVYGEEKNILYWHDKPKEPTKEGPPSFVLFEPQFNSVSTVSRIHPSLVSLRQSCE
jgi:hypothetical protein